MLTHSIETDEDQPYIVEGETAAGLYLKTGVNDYQTQLFKADLSFKRASMNDIVSHSPVGASNGHYFNNPVAKARAMLASTEMPLSMSSKARHSDKHIPSYKVSPENRKEETMQAMFENPMSGVNAEGMSIREESSAGNYDRSMHIKEESDYQAMEDSLNRSVESETYSIMQANARAGGHSATHKLYMYQQKKIRRQADKERTLSQSDLYYKSFMQDRGLDVSNDERMKHSVKRHLIKQKRAQERESPSRVEYFSHDEVPDQMRRSQEGEMQEFYNHGIEV